MKILNWFKSKKRLLTEIEQCNDAITHLDDVIDDLRRDLESLNKYRRGETKGVAHLGK